MERAAQNIGSPGPGAPASPWVLLAILVLAFAARLGVIFFLPSLAFPDETFQLLEQAHRLVFGYGVKPWEFESGIRSWVTPGVLAGLFRIASPLFGGPRGYIDFTRIALAALSLVPVVAVYRMGARTSRVHAVLVGVVAATWFEIVYFAIKPLTGALACDFALVALATASRPPIQISRKQFAVIGFCLGLTVMLRLQLAPGAAFVALWIARLRFRDRWTPLVLGALPVLLIFGVVDWLTWGYPFRSFVDAVLVNLVQNRAHAFGDLPVYSYFSMEYYIWLYATPVIILLVLARARTSLLWIGFAAMVIAAHSLIPHKEYRFTYPAFGSLIIVAAMGSADFVQDARRSLGGGGKQLALGVGALWILSSAALASGPNFKPLWLKGRGLILSSYWLAGQPNLCGLMFYDDRWQMTGGYVYLHRDIPIFALVHDHARAKRATDAYNFIVVHRGSIGDFRGPYKVARCFGRGAVDNVCVMERPGHCRQDSSVRPLLTQTGLGAPWLEGALAQ